MATRQTALDASLPARLIAGLEARPRLVEAGAIVVAVAVFLVSVLPNLADHPVLTDDEAWVMSASYKLAREGVFGSDIFAGFFNADSRYYFNMPAHHLLVAGAFRLVGEGVAEARAVGIGYGIATLVLSYLLARRLYGVIAGLVTLGLLLFLRLSMGFDTGLPLQELAVNLRYDLAPVPFALGGVLVLLGTPSPRRAAIAGALFGVATLMQFYGAFMFPIAIAFLWFEAVPRDQRLKLLGALVGAGALVGLPYAVYIATDYDAFEGQAGTIDRRADFYDPVFYIENLIDEPDRFVGPLAIPFAFLEIPEGEDIFGDNAETVGLEAAPRRPSAKAGILFGLPLALGFAAWRAFKAGSRPDRLLALCLGGLVLQYTFLESTKFLFYWILVVPFLCAGIAGAVLWIFRGRSQSTLHLALAGVTALVLLVVFAEGSVARFNGLRTARAAASYEGLADRLHEQVPPGSRVVGATSLWWGLRDTEYRSYFLFFYLTRDDAGEFRTTISSFLDGFGAEYIVLTRKASNELDDRLSAADKRDWESFMQSRARHITRLEGAVAGGYGYIDIWRVQ
jgi:4-amino-4-deoxy-L-arabinose transferase-like glycosyltransferase